MAKEKNPLYVVTKKGNVVEEATSIVDALIKKLNLGPAIKILNDLFKLLLDMVKDYPTFIKIKEFIDSIMAKIEGLMAMGQAK